MPNANGTLLMWLCAASLATGTLRADDLSFNRDIRPILAGTCFTCHGPDANSRESDLRLDRAESATADRGGYAAIVAGDAERSEAIQRIFASDDDLRMPPAGAKRQLTEQQKNMLRQWVDQGAKFEPHWSFAPIERPAPPSVDGFAVEGVSPYANAIDRFVAAELARRKMQPAPQADSATLARRLAFDLTGLPPSPAQVERFVDEPSEANYESLVDELLASQRYGERMAVWWLDLVRYADSVGYHGDQAVSVHPFREWVIRAFNDNMPFDEFTIAQLAGDLLPSPNLDQRIASGYNRLGMMSAEGGVQDKEYRAKYAAERVRNLGGAWLGLTLGCAECHDHKFDPLTTKEFYQLEAFFADIKEKGLYEGAHLHGNWGPALQLPTPAQAAALAQLDAELGVVRQELEALRPELEADQAEWEKSLADASGARAESLPPRIRKLLAVDGADRSAAERAEITKYYRSVAPKLENIRDRDAVAKKSRDKLLREIDTMLVTETVEPRAIRVLPRGDWTDSSGELVEPDYPAFLPESRGQKTERRLSRLDLARWVVDREHPLTARVLVNRLWKLHFGAGVSRTVDDFGMQADWPSHPEMLDWLAAELIDSNWNVKHVVKLIVMSKTYRQSSLAARHAREIDPPNRWLARQGRFRLDAEMIRDNALCVSGMLVERIGGSSVHPYQPPGYWAYLNFPIREWQNSTGEDLYRRSVYIHWQRQYLHPSLLAFDAPTREECVADRPRSNTPLQSLVLLNDPIYIEAARAFAAKILREGGITTQDRLDFAFRRALSRAIRPEESSALAELLEAHTGQYRRDTEAARKLLAVGERTNPVDLDPVELAAWTSIARTILNLHATISRN